MLGGEAAGRGQAPATAPLLRPALHCPPPACDLPSCCQPRRADTALTLRSSCRQSTCRLLYAPPPPTLAPSRCSSPRATPRRRRCCGGRCTPSALSCARSARSSLATWATPTAATPPCASPSSAWRCVGGSGEGRAGEARPPPPAATPSAPPTPAHCLACNPHPHPGAGPHRGHRLPAHLQHRPLHCWHRSTHPADNHAPAAGPGHGRRVWPCHHLHQVPRWPSVACSPSCCLLLPAAPAGVCPPRLLTAALPCPALPGAQ